MAIKDLVAWSAPSLDFQADDVIETFRKLDLDNSGLITYSQFLCATFDKAFLSEQDLVERLFRDLDSIKEGFLTSQSIHLAMQRKGIPITEEQIEMALTEQGFHESSPQISLEEFKSMLIGFFYETTSE